MTKSNNFEMSESPCKQAILLSIDDISRWGQGLEERDDRNSVSNALYCAVSKRMSKRSFENDLSAYLAALIADVSEGKREFSEVCYANDFADDTFRKLNSVLMQILSEQ
jgi:hypothetical protein